MNPIYHDLRYALRQLGRSPGFTAVAVLTLALGIGANTAIFSVVNAVLLRPLAYQDSGRLVQVLRKEEGAGQDASQLSFPNYWDLRERSRSFSELAAYRYWIFTLSGSRAAETFLGVFVTADLLPALRVRPALGRGFPVVADQPGRTAEVVLSDAAWRSRYGGDPHLVGTEITLDGHPATVVGILPRDFRFPGLAPADAPLPSREPDVYVPIGMDLEGRDSRGGDNYWVFGRLMAGITEAQAREDVGTIGAALAQEYPDNNRYLALDIASLQNQVVSDAKGPLLVLLGAVGLVLLIACTNVAGLLLARAASRRREFALRAALGASSGRLVRQVLTESILLALVGGGLGIILASWGLQAIRLAAPNSLPRVTEATLDGRMLGFTLVVSLFTGLFFGLSPALQSSRHSASESLKEGARGSAGSRRRSLRGLLVVGEVAMSLILLAGAGLLLRSFVALLQVDPGFDSTNVISMVVLLPPSRYPDDASRMAFSRSALARLGALSGVQSAGVVNTIPLSNLGDNTSFQVVGHPEPVGGRPIVPYRTVAGSYFDVLRIRLTAGRGFTGQDGSTAPPVAILSEAAARRFFPGEDPLGRQIQLGQGPPRSVVGIARDVRDAGVDRPVVAEVFYPFEQGPEPIFTLVARTAGDPHDLVPAIRRELAAIDPQQSVFLVRTLPELLTSSLDGRRFHLWLLAGFAGSALALAAIGLYGVVAYSVAQRTREIGIRVALGAKEGVVLGLLLREGLGLALAGVAIGLIGVLGVTRVLASQLYGVGPLDPPAIGGVVLILLAVAFIATLIPARRATRVDPMVALRAE